MSQRSHIMPGILAVALALSAGACSDRVASPFGPEAPRSAAIKFWDAGSSVAWNTTARQLAGARASSPVAQARLFGYLSIAQYNAIVAAEDAKEGGDHASPAAAAAGASVMVLKAFFPMDHGLIDATMMAQRGAAVPPNAQTENFAAGEAIGRAIGAAVVAYAATDGTNLTAPPPNPGGPNNWTGMNPVVGLYGVRPLTLESGDQFEPPPPPDRTSQAFADAVAELHTLTDALTPERLDIARAWATRGPAFLNGIATEMIVSHHRTEREAARTLALANMALFDATIGCFDAKLTYWYIRPVQADPTLHLWIAMPNHPSYPSGHSCQTASIATVLANVFPDEAPRLEALIVEAGLSRMYGGLHYRFDCEAGQELGRQVAGWVLDGAVNRQTAIALD